MTQLTPITIRPLRLLSSNAELKPHKIWSWTLPAFVVETTDGRRVNVCPNAGVCATVCYARSGTYMFGNVKARHIANLEYVLDDLDGWTEHMITELSHKRYRPTGVPRENAAPDMNAVDQWVRGWANLGGAAVRIHDAGDFFSNEYLLAWIAIANAMPDILFYAYTKEVTRFREIAKPNAPANFRWLYSMGGREDRLINQDTERHAEVFATVEDAEAAGYLDQEINDLWAVTLPTTRVGVPANNIKHFNKKLAGRTFGQLQTERDDRRESRRLKDEA